MIRAGWFHGNGSVILADLNHAYAYLCFQPVPSTSIKVHLTRTEDDGTTATVEKYVVDGWDTSKPSPRGTENFDVVMDLDGSDDVTMLDNTKGVATEKPNAPLTPDAAPGAAAAPKVSPTIIPQELIGKTANQIRQLAKNKRLVPYPTKPDKWMDR